MLMIILIALEVLFAVSFSGHSVYLDPTEMLAESGEVKLPKTVKGQRAPTVNNTGYIFYVISPVGTDFIDQEARADKKVLEVGSGFGNIVAKALERGVGEYTANDLEKDHLKLLMTRLKSYFGQLTSSILKRLKLLEAKAPEEFPSNPAYYDAVLVDKVLHFMAPVEIEMFLAWLKTALKPGGKLYIVTVSPYLITFRDKVLKTYLENSAQGMDYPGVVVNTEAAMHIGNVDTHHPQFRIPQTMVFFALPDLVRLLEKRGFAVDKTYSLAMPTDEQPIWEEVPEDQSAFVGVVASIPVK